MKIIKNTMVSIVFMLVTGVLLLGQTVPELEKQLEKVAGKEKVEILNQLSYAHRNLSVEKVLKYGEQALRLARDLSDRKGEGVALINIGIGYTREGNFEKSLESLQKSLEILENLGDKANIALALNNMGNNFTNFGHYDKALEHFQKALKLREEVGSKKEIASTLGNMAVIYKILGNPEKDMEYQLKALAIREEIGDERGIAISMGNIAHIYGQQRNFKKALAYYQKALEFHERVGNKSGAAIILESIGNTYGIEDFRKKLEYSRKSLKIKEEIGDKPGICVSLNNTGECYRKLKKYDKALEYYLDALKLAEEIKDINNTYIFLNNIAITYANLKRFDKASLYLEKSEKIREKNKINNDLGYLDTMYEVSLAKEDYKKALEYFVEYVKKRTTQFTEFNSKNISEMQAKYDTLKKEKEIEALKKDKQIQELVLERQTMVRDAAIIISMLSVILFLQFFRRYRYLFTFWKRKSYIAHYRLLDKIGSGGMGDIYKARDIREKSRSRSSSCAVKVLKEEYYKDDKYKARFKNEAALIDQLHHPHIVKVIERGEHDGTLYIAMELLEGDTLAGFLDKEKPMGLKTALAMMIQMAGALAAIHKRGIIHRDLKPENIMVTQAGDNTPFIKVLDFGLARTQNLTRLTRTGLIMGTIFYVAPEQLTRSAILPAGDIYSLGVICYQVLTGEKPFSGDTAFGIARQIMNKEPMEIKAFQPGVPAELSELVKEMMARDPGKRPSAGEVLNRLSEIEKSTGK